MKTILKIFAVFIVAFLFATIQNLNDLYAEGPMNGHQTLKFMEQLNDDQKEEINNMIADMKEDGAAKREIHEAVKKKMLEYGIELPERIPGLIRSGPFGPDSDLIADQLTEEQKTAIQEKVESMRQEGTDRKVIHEEVRKMIESYGLKIPEKGHRGYRGGNYHDWEHLAKDLSDEQKSAIKTKVESMREQGADRKEIHEEIRNMLKNYGVEVPDHPSQGTHRGMRHGGLFFGADLTDKQKEAIKEKVNAMHENDASREEIHETVIQMLTDYGVKIPEDFQKHREIMKNLNEKQRDEVRKIIRSMRHERASREEIRQAVDQLLKGYGITLPESELPKETSKNDQRGEVNIQNFPNPFNPETNIQYSLQYDSDVDIRIFDVQGKQVRSLLNQRQSSGTHNIRWDGLNENGLQVPSGIYFIRLSTDNDTISKRIVMTK